MACYGILYRVPVPFGKDCLFEILFSAGRNAVIMCGMEELLRSTDIVYISWVQHVLTEADIQSVVFDNNTSIVEGSIGMLIPSRVMVLAEDLEDAKTVIAEAQPDSP